MVCFRTTLYNFGIRLIPNEIYFHTSLIQPHLSFTKMFYNFLKAFFMMTISLEMKELLKALLDVFFVVYDKKEPVQGFLLTNLNNCFIKDILVAISLY
jgi:hypothetical protein